MAIKKQCVVCGTEFLANRYNEKFCCDKCRDKGREISWRKSYEKKKTKRAKKTAQNKLDQTLEEAREQGLSYAELQIQRTLQKVARGEL